VDDSGRVWTGTGGGVFIYDPVTKNFNGFNNINGLLSLDISSVRWNSVLHKAFIGTYDGTIEISDNDFHWTHVTDIKSAGFPNPVIRDIIFRDSLAYIAGGFGLAILNMNSNVFVETALRLGNFQRLTMINNIMFYDGKIWAATEAGLAYADLNKPIADPQSWINITTDQGLPENETVGIINFNNNIYVATNFTVCRMDTDTFTVLVRNENYDPIKNLSIFKDKIVFSSQYGLRSPDNSILFNNFPAQLLGHLVYNHSQSSIDIVVFYSGNGLGFISSDTLTGYIPDTPISNTFGEITLDTDGRLWSATSKEPTGKGIMVLNNQSWLNINAYQYPQLVSNNYFRISSGPNNEIYAGNWGAGFLITGFDQSGNLRFTHYDTQNSPLTGITSAPLYVLAGNAARDQQGNLWIVNYGELSNGPILLALDKNNVFHTFDNCNRLNDRYYTPMIIDSHGTKWLGSALSSGLLYYNENGTLDNTADDICGIITSNNPNLPDNDITSIAEDDFGVIWVGTTSGLSAILNSGNIINNSTPVIRSISLLSSRQINDIAVDALNQKWLATNDGVVVLNADGTEITASFNADNTPLLNNTVLSIITDKKTGLVYFGTPSGLSVASSLSIEPLQDFSIQCYPQPFDPNKDIQMIIDGIAADAELRIVTISGSLIKVLNTTGRKTIWDGRDEFGNLVSSGVYMILATSTSLNTSSVGKFAVIRR
jgi:ligand-binding sensor domain-containing protein